jgi:hypothetical protein
MRLLRLMFIVVVILPACAWSLGILAAIVYRSFRFWAL